MDACHVSFLARAQTFDPLCTNQSLASNPGPQLNLPSREPMQLCLLILRVSIYTESIETAVLSRDCHSIQYIVVFMGHVYSIKSAPNRQHLVVIWSQCCSQMIKFDCKGFFATICLMVA